MSSVDVDCSSSSDVEVDLASSLAQFDQLSRAIEQLQQHMTPILDKSLKQVAAQITPIQAAKLQAALAYASSALFFIYLHTSGNSTENHPVKKELERVKKYLKKIADATAPPTESSEAKENKGKVDKGAAKRFISAQLANQTAADAKKSNASKNAIQVDSDDSESSSDDPEIVSATSSVLKSQSVMSTPSKSSSASSKQPNPSPSTNKRSNESQKAGTNKKSAKKHKTK